MSPENREDRLSEGRLSEALGLLARHSRRSAPPEVGAALLDAFRQRQAARGRVRTMRLTAMAALLCLAAGLVFMTRTAHPERASMAVSIQPSVPPVREAENTRGAGPAGSPARTSQPQLRRTPPAQRAEQSSDFMALPGWSSATTGEQLRIVRMELPASALRMVGAPVSEEVTERPVLADFVVGQDGTPYAMRLVQQ
jgi:hypothetical protein